MIDLIQAVESEGNRAFIVGATVSGDAPDNWRHAVDVGIDGILTDYPLELGARLRDESQNRGKR